MITFAAAIAVVLAAAPTKKSEKLIFNAPDSSFTILLHSPESVDTIAMRCRTEDYSDKSLAVLDCEFEQVIVSKKEPHDPADEPKIQERLRKEFAAPGALRKSLRACDESKKYTARSLELNTNEFKRAEIARDQAFTEKLCACKDAECVIAALIERARSEPPTCTIMATEWKATFKRQSENRWVSVAEPSGLCGVVLTLVIEYSPSADAWTYTQRRTVTGDESSEFCAGISESPSKAYSHSEYIVNPLMGCEKIGTIIP